jgi:SAM-dependent methyltransferase
MAYTLVDRFLAWRRFKAALPYVKSNSCVCDVGCGLEGEFLQYLRVRKKIRLGVGLDYQAQESVAGGVYVVAGDITRGLPFRSGMFDHTVMLAVLEHLAHPEAVLREAHRILAPGGSLVMTWPNEIVDPILAVLRKIKAIGHEMESDKHEERIPINRLQAMLREIGFDHFEHRIFEFGLNNVLEAHKTSKM